MKLKSRTGGAPWPESWATILAVALALAEMLLLFPGVASYDALFAYGELRRGLVTDWHPPVMIRLWSALEALGLSGTGPLFLVQMEMFWIGLGMLAAARARRGRTASALAVLAVGLLPLVLGRMDEVLKDSQMVGAMVCAVALVASFRLTGRALPRSAEAVAMLLLAYATLLRSNALFATVPVVVILAGMGRRAILGGTMMLAIAIAAPLINRDVFRAEPAHAERSQMLFDMAGTAHFAHLPSIDGVPPPVWARAERVGCYNPVGWDSFSQMPKCEGIWRDLRARPLFAPWLRSVAWHPIAYAEHRLGHLNMTLRFLVPWGQPRATGQGWSTPNPWKLGGDRKTAHKLQKIERSLSATPAGWPIAWVGFGLVLLWSAASMDRGPVRETMIALLGSALVLEASFLVVSVASDMRYHLWTIVAVGLSGALLIGERGGSRVMLPATAVLTAITLCGYAARDVLPPAWPSWM